MFKNWLNGIDRKHRLEYTLEFLVYVVLYGSVEIISFLQGWSSNFFIGYSYGCAVDLVMVFCATVRSMGTYVHLI
jgi:hypothetical protein